jgi:hypothetical protein
MFGMNRFVAIFGVCHIAPENWRFAAREKEELWVLLVSSERIDSSVLVLLLPDDSQRVHSRKARFITDFGCVR